jgi:hypothetical protein
MTTVTQLLEELALEAGRSMSSVELLRALRLYDDGSVDLMLRTLKKALEAADRGEGLSDSAFEELLAHYMWLSNDTSHGSPTGVRSLIPRRFDSRKRKKAARVLFAYLRQFDRNRKVK